MAQDLTATQSSGTQNTTQSPQVAGSDTGGGTQSSALQTGTPAAALSSTQGIPLATRSLTGKTAVPPPVKAHHGSPFLTVLAVILFLVAMGLFALLARVDKTTTES